MKMLKIAALGFVLATTSACSKDDGGCNPQGKLQIAFEQGYSMPNRANLYVNEGSSKQDAYVRGEIIGDNSGDVFYRDLRYSEGIQDLMAMFPDKYKIKIHSGVRYLSVPDSDGEDDLLQDTTSTQFQSKLDSQRTRVSIVIDTAGVKGQLKKVFDDVAQNQGFQVCSSDINLLMYERPVSSREKSLAIVYEAQVIAPQD